MRKIVRSENAPRPRGPYSQGIVSGGFVFVAGQGAVNPKTQELELGDIRSETRRTLKNIEAILKASGSSLRDVVRVGVFLNNMKDFGAMNEVYREFFPADPPARTTVGAVLPKIKVEIDCIARVGRPRRRKRKKTR